MRLTLLKNTTHLEFDTRSQSDYFQCDTPLCIVGIFQSVGVLEHQRSFWLRISTAMFFSALHIFYHSNVHSFHITDIIMMLYLLPYLVFYSEMKIKLVNALKVQNALKVHVFAPVAKQQLSHKKNILAGFTQLISSFSQLLCTVL